MCESTCRVFRKLPVRLLGRSRRGDPSTTPGDRFHPSIQGYRGWGLRAVLTGIMKCRTFETGLAWFSLVGAFVHFVLETLYHIAFGQFLPLLIVDYIAVGLLVYAGVLSLK